MTTSRPDDLEAELPSASARHGAGTATASRELAGPRLRGRRDRGLGRAAAHAAEHRQRDDAAPSADLASRVGFAACRARATAGRRDEEENRTGRAVASRWRPRAGRRLRQRRRATRTSRGRRRRSSSPRRSTSNAVSVSPKKFGAGPITLIVTNQTGASQQLTARDRRAGEAGFKGQHRPDQPARHRPAEGRPRPRARYAVARRRRRHPPPRG